MKITVLAVGKMKEDYLKEALEEYKKRLGRYCRLEIIEVADEKTPQQASFALEECIKKKEGERLLGHIQESNFVITLEICGTQVTSEDLAHKIEHLGISGISHITFVIGGSLGLSQEVLIRSNWSLSFSKMTFPHQLMRVILLEQIYRSHRIIQGEPYHK